MKSPTEPVKLVRKCREEMIDSAGGGLEIYRDFLDEAKKLEDTRENHKAAIVMFAGRPEELQAKQLLEAVENEIMHFRAMVYRLYGQI